jgi:hypothetical protein
MRGWTPPWCRFVRLLQETVIPVDSSFEPALLGEIGGGDTSAFHICCPAVAGNTSDSSTLVSR